MKKKKKFNENEADETRAGMDAEQEGFEAETEVEGDEQSANKVSEDGEDTAGDGKASEQIDAEDETQKQIDDLNDRLRRNMAEFDNFRKRTEKEKAMRFEMGQRSVIEKILPVIDNFERGLASLTDEQKEDAFAGGMDKTYKQMLSLLEELGVKPIEAVGETFNPDLHNAVMHVEDESQPENVVVEELQKGYKMGDAVIRYSMVKVAN